MRGKAHYEEGSIIGSGHWNRPYLGEPGINLSPGIGSRGGSGQQLFEPGSLGCLRQLQAAWILSQTETEEQALGRADGTQRRPRVARATGKRLWWVEIPTASDLRSQGWEHRCSVHRWWICQVERKGADSRRGRSMWPYPLWWYGMKECRSVEVDNGKAQIRRVDLNYVALFGNAQRANMKE